jgi:hypothetical protein
MRIFVKVVPVAAVVLMLTVCGQGKKDPGVASIQSKGPSSASSVSDVPSDSHQRALAFAKCMRDNGVDMQDPPAGVPGAANAMPAVKGDPNDPKTAKAFTTCQKYLPGGGTGDDDADAKKRDLAFRKCLREHGMDVTDDQGLTIDMSNPKMKQAVEACKSPTTSK